MDLPAELRQLANELNDATRDAKRLVSGLTEEQAAWHAGAAQWSVAQCLDHLATTNRIYLAAMRPAADRARAEGQLRHSPAVPGWGGKIFVWMLEPPVKKWLRGKAPDKIRPRPSPTLKDAFHEFEVSQNEVLEFLVSSADLDLSGTRFTNPLIRGLDFSLATGLNNIAAHERRHLWQAWQAREAALIGR